MTSPTPSPSSQEDARELTDEQIKHMADRFLGWKLPADFNPDGGVSIKQPFGAPWPIGTNLFTARQAVEMVRYLAEGLPRPTPDRTDDVGEMVERVARAIAHRFSGGKSDNPNGAEIVAAEAAIEATGVLSLQRDRDALREALKLAVPIIEEEREVMVSGHTVLYERSADYGMVVDPDAVSWITAADKALNAARALLHPENEE
jgi:hypothetical protein